MEKLSRDAIIAEVKQIATRLGVDTLRRKDFTRESKIKLDHVYKFFPDGGWREVLETAGLRVAFQNEATPDDELMEEFHRVVKEMGGLPTGIQLDSQASFSFSVYKKRYGGIQGTLRRYRAWLEEHHPDAPEQQLVQAKSKHEIITPVTHISMSGQRKQWAKSDGVEYGAPISFRGLRHAPINEQGVVYLFGMVSSELGLIVEAVQSTYPNCEAKRCIDRNQNRWQRVRIEFEFYSSNFRDHGHDPDGCDMIVCWEHDWADCPLEVVELRSIIDQLEG